MCTVVIPCYNYGAYLEEAVASALGQTLASVEVIVVDDGSTDPQTLDVARSLIGRPRITVIFKNNKGLSAARNTGIGAARSRYICCLDADDVLPSCYVEQCTYIHEAHRNVGTVCGWVKQFGQSSNHWITEDFRIDSAINKNMTAQASVYVKADWALAGGYDETFVRGYEDWEFWLRMGALGRRGVVMATDLFHRRRHGESMLDRSKKFHHELVEQIRNANARLYSDTAWINRILEESRRPDPFVYPETLAADQAKARGAKARARILHVRDKECAPLSDDTFAEFEVIELVTGPVVYKNPAEHRDPVTERFHMPPDGFEGGVGTFARYLAETRAVDGMVVSGSRRHDVETAMREALPKVPLVEPADAQTVTRSLLQDAIAAA